MGIETGVNSPNAFNYESDWNTFYKNKSKPLLKNIGSGHYSIFKEGSSFFLTDKNENYQGQLELKIENKVAYIISSHSKLKGGFYNIMFMSLFSLKIFNVILSDTKLSTQALKSYQKLKINGHLKINVFDGSSYIEYTEENYKKAVHNRVSIRENTDIYEVFNEYYSRIYSKEKSAFKNEFELQGSGIDNWLFCENWNKE